MGLAGGIVGATIVGLGLLIFELWVEFWWEGLTEEDLTPCGAAALGRHQEMRVTGNCMRVLFFYNLSANK